MPWEDHRQAGFDSPLLFDTRANAVKSELVSMFYKGGTTKTPLWGVVA